MINSIEKGREESMKRIGSEELLPRVSSTENG
jgi:hypothetical protein